MSRPATKTIVYRGETHLVQDLCDRFGIRDAAVYYRLKKGWTVERAFETPVGSRVPPRLILPRNTPDPVVEQPMSAGEVDQALHYAVRIETAPPWVRHPQPIDPRDVARCRA